MLKCGGKSIFPSKQHVLTADVLAFCVRKLRKKTMYLLLSNDIIAHLPLIYSLIYITEAECIYFPNFPDSWRVVTRQFYPVRHKLISTGVFVPRGCMKLVQLLTPLIWLSM
jgi:hypothetical protein